MIKKNEIVCPQFTDAVIKFSDPRIINASTCITIPIQYKAFVYIDDKSLLRFDPCKRLNFVKKYGKEYIGKQIKLAFVWWKNLEEISWQFSPTAISEAQEKLPLFANGRCRVEIINYPRLISGFYDKKSISENDIRNKILAAISNRCVSVLTDLYLEKCNNCDKNLCIELSVCAKTILDNDLFFQGFGVRLTSFIVDSIEEKVVERESASV